jgi:ABC-type Fe3+ transport system substrate-binding protein
MGSSTAVSARFAIGLLATALVATGCSSSAGSATAGNTDAATPPSSGATGPASSGASAGAAGSFVPTSAETAVCEAAKAEKTLNFRAGTGAEAFEQEIKPFEQLYPWIKINFTSQKPQTSVPLIVTQAQANHTLDVDGVKMDIPGAGPLLEKKLLETGIDWQSLGVPSDVMAQAEGVSTPRTQRLALGLAYNTTKLSAKDLPDTWQDLINSKWAGKIIVDPRAEQLGGLAPTWTKQQTVDWYKQFLAVDKPMVVAGATASLQKVISGEALLSTSAHDAEVDEQQAKGAPVAIKFLDVVPVQDNYGFVLKDAPHPNAAKCFLAWFANPNGGAVQQMKYEFKPNATTPVGLPAGSQIAAPTDPKELAEIVDTADALAALTNGG